MIWKPRPGLRLWAAWVLMPLVLVVGGCGEEEVVDPYVYGSLDAVTRGHVSSESYLFEIDAPEFVLTHGNTGILRSGNHLEVIVADDLENRAPTWEGKLIGVQKFYTPFVFLMAKRVKDGLNITELDSVEQAVLPRFTDVKLDEVNGYDIGKLQWNKKTDIEDMFEAEVQTVGSLHYLPDHQYEAPEAPVVAEGEVAPEMPETPMAWYLKAEKTDAMFKITNVTPSLELAFKILEAEGLPFVGGITIGECYTYKDRRASRISAPVEVDWVRYANRYLAP